MRQTRQTGAGEWLRHRLMLNKGADVASAGTLALGDDGNLFDITGTTTINYVSTANWRAGSTVILQFDGALTLAHNTGSVPAGAGAILLQGAGNLTTAAGDRIQLTYDGTNWLETARSIVAGIAATDIAAGAVGTSELATNAVTTAKITDANVTLAKIVNGTGLSVIGRGANSAGVNADIVGTDGQVLRVAGTALGFGTVAAAGITAGVLVGTQVAVLADDAVIGGIPVVINVAIADGVTADKNVVLTHKTEILDIIVQKRGAAGGASDTIQVKNTADVISDAIDINIADKVVKRAATIDDAFSTIAAAGTLRITMTKASAANTACQVTIIGVRRT